MGREVFRKRQKGSPHMQTQQTVDRVAVVTGGASGIGAAIARQLGAQG